MQRKQVSLRSHYLPSLLRSFFIYSCDVNKRRGRQRDETKMISLLVPATCRPVIDDDLCVKIAHAIDVNTSSRCDVSSKSDETLRRQFIEGA